MVQTKVFRTAHPPTDFLQRFPGPLRSVKAVELGDAVSFVARYRKSRWHWLNEARDTVRHREIYCWLLSDGSEVGAIEIHEFKVCPFVENGLFWELMDSESQSANDLAQILVTHWHDVWGHLAAEGPIVLIERLWVAPQHAKYSQWATVVRRLLATEFRRRCIVVLKAFPLEYEGKGYPAGFRLRQRAMIRHYRRLLGLVPFPGKPGREGWLYVLPQLALRNGIQKPKRIRSLRSVV